ncbi:hypothetical protein EDC01DRAFT_22165 [Geopyxis carbonaria]|nr:hypothetical protein EDC01DRAFT_22165 [Geopyxis carbonaria]
MTELSFAKSYLATLAQRPQRLAADHVEDPRKLPARGPYTLPRTLPDYVKPKTAEQVAEEQSNATANLTLKPLRPNAAVPPLTLPSMPLSTNILALKMKYSGAANTSTAKIKLLLKGKPLSDEKTLKDLGVEAGADAVLTVMIMGGVASPPPPPEVQKVAALQGEDFWVDLKKFLDGKLGADGVKENPEEVLQAFRKAWRG